MKAEEIRAWSLRARRNDTIAYHRGLLMRDRQKSSAVERSAEAAWSLYEAGAVVLWQLRFGDSDYQYIAVKR